MRLISIVPRLGQAILLTALLLNGGASQAAETLIINSMHSDPMARKAFESAVDSFKKANPDVDVKINNTSHEAYKVQIRTWLPNDPPDIATWFAGNRAKYFVDRGLVEPIDDIWKELETSFPEGIKNVVTFDGKRYLMPASFYHWGIYYRKDLFAKAGVTAAPATWDELKAAVVKLKAAGITPFTIGSKNGWPAAAWFDYLDLRTNGYDFHMALLSGKEKYTDPRVKNVMAKWKELIALGAFSDSGPAMTWQEGAALLWQGRAAMYLMGNFMTGEIPKGIEANVGFFPFPTIDPKVSYAEVSPTDIYFIPAKAKHKAAAKRFLAHIAKPETQTAMNALVRQLPTNNKATFDKSDPFLAAGWKMLNEAKGLGQFYDRDSDPQVAQIGMDAFVEFMRYPDRSDAILEKIEKARLRVHGNPKS